MEKHVGEQRPRLSGQLANGGRYHKPADQLNPGLKQEAQKQNDAKEDEHPDIDVYQSGEHIAFFEGLFNFVEDAHALPIFLRFCAKT